MSMNETRYRTVASPWLLWVCANNSASNMPVQSASVRNFIGPPASVGDKFIDARTETISE